MSTVETSAPVDAAKTTEVAPEATAPAEQPETVQPAPEAAKEATTEPAEATPAAAPSDAPAPEPTGATEPTTTMTTPAETEATPKAQETAPKVEEKEEEEPQNELTKKFTEKEWTALKEFRKGLPDVFKKAYVEKEGYTPAPIVLWTVTIDPNGKKDAKASVVLMKFLRARDLNVELAKEMMVHTLRWRDEFGVEAAIQETFPEDVFGNLGHIYGRSKNNQPITYNLYGQMGDLKTVFGDKNRFMRWRIKLMEEGITKLDFETVDQMIQVHDYEGVGWNSRDANSKAAASEISNIFSNHYPEFLSHKLFVNVPSAFTWIFWLFKPLLPAATLAKMKVAGRGPHGIGKELLPLIDAEQLPKQYGGKADAPFGSK